MGTKNFFMVRTNFHFVDRAFLLEFLYKNMFWLLGLLCHSLFFVFGSIMRYFSRDLADENSEKNESSFRIVESQEENQIGGSCDDGLGKKETSEMGFLFHGGTETDTVTGIDEDEDYDEREEETKSSVFSAPTAMTSKYQFISGGNISGFVEEPTTTNLTVQELFVGSVDSTNPTDQIIEKLFSGGCNFEAEDSVLVEEEKAEESVLSFSFGRLTMHPDEPPPVLSLEYDVLGKHDFYNEAQLHSENQFCPNPESVRSENELGSCEFLLGENVMQSSEPIVERDDSDEYIELIPHMQNSSLVVEETVYVDDSGDSNNVSEEEAVANEDTEQMERSERAEKAEKLSFDDSEVENEEEEEEAVDFEETEQMERSERAEKLSFDDSEEEEEAVGFEETEQMERSEKDESSDDSEEEDIGWNFISEHQDLIEQLKVELKNVRIGGLPTILEESESPKIVEDLKPLKINEKKLEHKDRIEQIHKVYKSYAEKMKKLDVLNYQTMHAIGFIRRKDQSQLISVRKTSAMKFPFLQNLMGSKTRMVGDDPIGELERDLELVYVGQACLSWKILYWQYGKANELSDYDPQGFRLYNQVAGEFQLFQVLMQRYVEDETFQGPRVQHYVKNRCILRNLLQVPVIRDDKDKKTRRGEEENAISSAMLSKIINECMRFFWEFIRADKKGTNVISKGTQQHIQADLQNPTDANLLIDVQTDLQKKERKLKEILRTGNCIVKKFQKHQESRLDHELFIAQVELRLVSRVLNMSRLTTQQLIWCQEQLDKINFTSRKVYLEPSFLMFPC